MALLAIRYGRRGVRRYVSRATARSMAKFADSGKHSRAALRAETLGNVMSDVLTLSVWVLAVFAILGELGVDLAPLIAGAGIAGVAIGFGTQSLVKDFFSGFFMLLEDQYGVGDVITVTQEVAGQVEDISLRVTRLRALDGTVWFVPNGEIRYLGNRSKEWARALIDVQVAYGEDVEEVMQVIRDVGAFLRRDETLGPKILEDIEILGVENLADSGVVVRCYIKTLPLEQWEVGRRFREQVKRAFDARNIEIPVPHRKIMVQDGSVRPGPGDLPAGVHRGETTG